MKSAFCAPIWLLSLLANSADGRSQPNATNSPAYTWKFAEIKELTVERWAIDERRTDETEKPILSYRFQVDLTSHVEPDSQWAGVRFKPSGEVPKDVGSVCHVTFEMQTGWIAKVSFIDSITFEQADKELTEIGDASVLRRPLESTPVEMLFPTMPSQEFVDPATKAKVEVIRSVKGDDIIMMAKITIPGQAHLRITQTWRKGENWWREFVREINGQKQLHARLVSIVSTDELDKMIREDINLFLSMDKRLGVKVTIVDPDAKTSKILDILQKSTGVTLTLDDSLEGYDPELGDMQMRDSPAWIMMKLIAQIGFKNGKWEHFNGGYRLKAGGPMPTPDMPAPPKNTPLVWWLSIGLGIVLLVVLIRYRLRLRTKQTVPTEAKKDDAKSHPNKKPSRSGITLVELLVVLAIIGVLIALLIPAVQRVRESANRLQCASNLKQIALAIHAYHDVDKRIPYNQFGPYGGGPNSYAWSWLARLLPYIEQNNVYVTGQIPVETLEQSGVMAIQIPTFLCPSDNANIGPRLDAGNLTGVAVGQTNYKGVSGSNWGDDGEGNGGVDFPTDWRNAGTNGSFGRRPCR